MLLYDKIIEVLQELLPANFMLTYNNNLDTNWAEILPEVEDETVHGVLRVDSGSNDYVGTQTIKTENMRITFVIPNKVDVFKPAVEAIELLKNNYGQGGINDCSITISTRTEDPDNNAETDNSVSIPTIARILVDGRSSGAIERINSVDWITTDLYFQVQIYEDLLTSDSYTIEVKINNSYKELDVPIADVVYDYASNMEAKILGVGQVPTNIGTGNQKQLIITVIPQPNKPVYKAIIEKEDDADYKWSIKYNNGIITRTFDAKLVGINEHVPTGGTYGVTLKFLRTA